MDRRAHHSHRYRRIDRVGAVSAWFEPVRGRMDSGERPTEVFRVEESRVLHNLGKDLIGVLVGIAGNDVQRLELGPGVEPECRLLP